MKLRYEFKFEQVGDDIAAVPMREDNSLPGFILQLNNSGAEILKYIAESDSPDEVLVKLAEDYPDDDRNDIEQKFRGFINKLTEEGILEH